MHLDSLIKYLPRGVVLSAVLLSFMSVAEPTAQLKKVGQGNMSWLFMDIYQASLFSQDGEYTRKSYPLALSILYHRNISKQNLIKATEKQWQHLSYEADKYQDWLQDVERLWPDIKKNDRLTFLVSKSGTGGFYHNNNWLGNVENSYFSDAFLSIWLSPNTSEPKLRQKLIGVKK